MHDALQNIEDYLSSIEPQSEKYVLRLYVTGMTAHSQRAIQNLTNLCAEHLHERYDLEVIDLLKKPTLARDEQIVAAPTLLKLLPLPVRRIVGDLSDGEHVLVGLDLRVSRRSGNATDRPRK